LADCTRLPEQGHSKISKGRVRFVSFAQFIGNAVVIAGPFAYACLIVAPRPNDPVGVITFCAPHWLGFLMFLAAVDWIWQDTQLLNRSRSQEIDGSIIRRSPGMIA
jgi:hypothetical protein